MYADTGTSQTQDYQDIRLGLKDKTGGDNETQVQLIRGQIPDDSGKSGTLL